MSTINKPDTTFNIEATPSVSEVAAQRILFVGQQIDDTSDENVLVKDIGNGGTEDQLFGKRSMLASMIRRFRKTNTLSTVDAIPLNDPAGGAAASGSIVFTGTATKSVTLPVSIQSKKSFTFNLPINTGDTASVVSSNLADLVNANDQILITADGVTTPGTTALDVSFLGTEGNSISIGIDRKVPVSGLTIVINGMSGATGIPVTSTILAQLQNIRYQTVVWPASYSKSDIVDFLNTRFNSTNDELDGVVCMHQTVADELAAAAISLALNSQSCIFKANLEEDISTHKGQALFEFDPLAATDFAALRTLRLTQGANISSIIPNSSTVTTFGGPFMAAIPYHNTPFSLLSPIDIGRGWTKEQQAFLNDNGVSFLGNSAFNNGIIMGDAVTTYLTDDGNPDKTYKYLNYVDTASTIREFMATNTRKNFAQNTLTKGDIVAGTGAVNAITIKAYIVSLYIQLSARDKNNILYALVLAGSPAVKYFKDNLTVELDLMDGSATLDMSTPIVSQYRSTLATIRTTFNI